MNRYTQPLAELFGKGYANFSTRAYGAVHIFRKAYNNLGYLVFFRQLRQNIEFPFIAPSLDNRQTLSCPAKRVADSHTDIPVPVIQSHYPHPLPGS